MSIVACAGQSGVLPVTVAASVLGIQETYVLHLVGHGKLTHAVIGGHPGIPADSLWRYIQ